MIQEFINYLDFMVYGAGLPGMVMVVVTVTTVVTTLRLRKAAAWRLESSSGTLSSREVALTKMLIGSSILFIVCVSPICLFRLEMKIVPCFLAFSSCYSHCPFSFAVLHVFGVLIITYTRI